MRHLYWALSEVTRFGRPDVTEWDRPVGWRAWIAGIALLDGLVCWLLATLLYLLFRIHFVGVVLAAAAVCLWEHYLHSKKFPGGITVAARMLLRKHADEKIDETWLNVVKLGVTLLKPVLVMAICGMEMAIWLIVYAMLAMCITLDFSGGVLVRQKTVYAWKSVAHWIVAIVAIALLGLVAGAVFTLVAVVALAIAFVLSEICVRYFPPEIFDKRPVAKAFYLTLGELAMLAVGVVGLAI